MYIFSSTNPNVVYTTALNYISRTGEAVDVWEIDPCIPMSSLYFMAITKGKDPERDGQLIKEMTIEVELFGKSFAQKDRRMINKIMRRIDDSQLWPICGKFNATERAIRRLAKWEQQGGVFDCAYSYWKAIEQELSDIVNKEM